VGRQYEGQANRRRLTLDLSLQEDLPPLSADPVALERIFTNLVQNAVKFTPAGGAVTLTSLRQGTHIVVIVEDSGPGIRAEDAPHVFERRHRRDAPSQRPSASGCGLGLFIAKMLVEAHGGRIEVSSQPGRGTAFLVLLPVGKMPARPERGERGGGGGGGGGGDDAAPVQDPVGNL
jgi:two-component system phosphate regulon sensor histidine kinase PhoR